MKMVKLNAKSNFVFLLIFLILGMLLIGVSSFGQGQLYGDSSLVDMEIKSSGKAHYLYIYPNEILKEVVYLEDHETETVEVRISEWDGDFRVDLSKVANVYLITSDGITFLSFLREHKTKYLVLNGKIIGRVKGKKYMEGPGKAPVDKFKDTIFLEYTTL